MLHSLVVKIFSEFDGMKPPNYKVEEQSYQVNEEPAVYASREALEDARLREAINRTDTEKFRMFTRMMCITQMMNRAKIIHKPAL